MSSSEARPPAHPPSFFRHAGFPDWGVGIALFRDDAREELTLVFERGGLRTVSLAKRVLVSVPAARLDEALRGRLRGLAKGRGEPANGRAALAVVRRRRQAQDDAAPRAAAVPAPTRDDGSSDVMDRKRRIPGSYEAGKRR